jgi:threonine dehydrogenase-like Zn-dependent dehydrogenase
MMRGLISDGRGKIWLAEDIPVPEPTDYTALVRTIACGICNGTDLKLKDGHLRGFTTYPAVLGHESVGEVVAVGRKVRKFKLGDRVVRSSLPNAGIYHSLWGGFAEYGLVTDDQAMNFDEVKHDGESASQQRIPAEIDPLRGVMVITLKEVYSALKRLNFYAGASVAIYGGGPAGLAMVNCTKIMGAGFIALCDHHEERLKTAKRLGADLTVNSEYENFEKSIIKCIPRLDFVIDAVGRNTILSAALRLIRPSGTIGLYGIGIENDKPIEWSKGPYNWNLHSVQWPVSKEEAAINEEVTAHILRGTMPLEEYVTHILPIERFDEGFELVKNRQGLKISLSFR